MCCLDEIRISAFPLTRTKLQLSTFPVATMDRTVLDSASLREPKCKDLTLVCHGVPVPVDIRSMDFRELEGRLPAHCGIARLCIV